MLTGILSGRRAKYMLCVEVDPDVHGDVCWSQFITNLETLWYYLSV